MLLLHVWCSGQMKSKQNKFRILLGERKGITQHLTLRRKSLEWNVVAVYVWSYTGMVYIKDPCVPVKVQALIQWKNCCKSRMLVTAGTPNLTKLDVFHKVFVFRLHATSKAPCFHLSYQSAQDYIFRQHLPWHLAPGFSSHSLPTHFRKPFNSKQSCKIGQRTGNAENKLEERLLEELRF